MREVGIDAVPLSRLAQLLSPERAQRLTEYADRGRELFEGRTVWNVNTTATGGGVAEMLQALLAYVRGAGVDTRWLVIDGDPPFFATTKRLHNMLHGSPGDGRGLGQTDRDHYRSVLDANLEQMRERVKPGDIVLLHDPQTAGLVDGLREIGASAVWRCHVGRDTANDMTDQAWDFLRPHLTNADGHIFTRREYVPPWVPENRLWIIPPSLDPFTAKNRILDPLDVASALRHAGLVDLPGGGSLEFERREGTRGTVRRHEGLLLGRDRPIPGDVRVVLQVSRWDRLKDMAGVLRGVADHLDEMPDDVHLLLVGPEVSGVSDDPEGAEVLEECLELWRQLSPAAQERVHLCCLPMDDVDENAHLVNALQSHATVVVQKSLVEGFGLTVTEPMWKARPVLASAVGGIQDQIVDGENGLLLHDPTDLDEFAEKLSKLLGDQELALRLGNAARERVRDQFLGDRHLMQYVDLFTSVGRN